MDWDDCSGRGNTDTFKDVRDGEERLLLLAHHSCGRGKEVMSSRRLEMHHLLSAVRRVLRNSPSFFTTGESVHRLDMQAGLEAAVLPCRVNPLLLLCATCTLSLRMNIRLRANSSGFGDRTQRAATVAGTKRSHFPTEIGCEIVIVKRIHPIISKTD